MAWLTSNGLRKPAHTSSIWSVRAWRDVVLGAIDQQSSDGHGFPGSLCLWIACRSRTGGRPHIPGTRADGACGIEAAIHRATLAAGGDTITVLAGGMDLPCPRGNHKLLGRAGNVGTLVSEAPPGSLLTRRRFLTRSRLLGAISAVTVLVEADARPGALRRAQEARQLGRQVGAVPGPVISVTSHGPHELLHTGHERLVTFATDVEEVITEKTNLDADNARGEHP